MPQLAFPSVPPTNSVYQNPMEERYVVIVSIGDSLKRVGTVSEIFGMRHYSFTQNDSLPKYVFAFVSLISSFPRD